MVEGGKFYIVISFLNYSKIRSYDKLKKFSGTKSLKIHSADLS